MKNNEIRFEEMVEMGFAAPAGNMTDFSDQDYQKASERVDVIEKNGMKGLFIDGQFKRMKVNGQWVSKVDSVDAATKFFKG